MVAPHTLSVNYKTLYKLAPSFIFPASSVSIFTGYPTPQAGGAGCCSHNIFFFPPLARSASHLPTSSHPPPCLTVLCRQRKGSPQSPEMSFPCSPWYLPLLGPLLYCFLIIGFLVCVSPKFRCQNIGPRWASLPFLLFFCQLQYLRLFHEHYKNSIKVGRVRGNNVLESERVKGWPDGLPWWHHTELLGGGDAGRDLGTSLHAGSL